jgi:hypothetical protein
MYKSRHRQPRLLEMELKDAEQRDLRTRANNAALSPCVLDQQIGAEGECGVRIRGS